MAPSGPFPCVTFGGHPLAPSKLDELGVDHSLTLFHVEHSTHEHPNGSPCSTWNLPDPDRGPPPPVHPPNHLATLRR
jgi:hypothetical protein